MRDNQRILAVDKLDECLGRRDNQVGGGGSNMLTTYLKIQCFQTVAENQVYKRWQSANEDYRVELESLWSQVGENAGWVIYPKGVGCVWDIPYVDFRGRIARHLEEWGCTTCFKCWEMQKVEEQVSIHKCSIHMMFSSKEWNLFLKTNRSLIPLVQNLKSGC